MKGIILAGGAGTRLYPVTKVVSKQLMPIYDKPMIYYPLSCLMLAGIREILVISTPHDLPLFKQLLKTGKQWGLEVSYAEQSNPEGLAQALIIAEDFLDGSSCCLILGDNVFYGEGLSHMLRTAANLSEGGLIFGYYVNDPKPYGVIEFDNEDNVIGFEEKPVNPKSNFVIPGLYFYDSQAPKMAKSLIPSPRGELEITDLNKKYLEQGNLNVRKFGRGIAWLDTGTHDTMLQASNFIKIIIERQGLQIGCPEEIAFNQNWITDQQVARAAEENGKTQYGDYLFRLLDS